MSQKKKKCSYYSIQVSSKLTAGLDYKSWIGITVQMDEAGATVMSWDNQQPFTFTLWDNGQPGTKCCNS